MNHLLNSEYGLFPAIVVALIGQLACLGLLFSLRDRLSEIGYKVDTPASRLFAFLIFDPLGLAVGSLISPLLLPIYIYKIRDTWPRFRFILFAWIVSFSVTLAAWLLIAIGLR